MTIDARKPDAIDEFVRGYASARHSAAESVRRDAYFAEVMQTAHGRQFVFEEVLEDGICILDCTVRRADGSVDLEATGASYIEHGRARYQFARLWGICRAETLQMLTEAGQRITGKKQ